MITFERREIQNLDICKYIYFRTEHSLFLFSMANELVKRMINNVSIFLITMRSKGSVHVMRITRKRQNVAV